MTEFKKGDRVHVEFDGEVNELYNGGHSLGVRPDGIDVSCYVQKASTTLVEPTYERGAYYIDAQNNVFCRVHAGWRDAILGRVYRDGIKFEYPADSLPVRPFRKLVPES